MFIGMISAVSSNGVIGKNNTLPFHYPEDLKHFKKTTSGSIVIMGRNTFESIGRALPGRQNIVITRSTINAPNIKCMTSINEAVLSRSPHGNLPIWLIGGAQIYQEGMKWAQEIVLTVTPDVIDGEDVVRFPFINPLKFNIVENKFMETDLRLKVVRYKRSF